MKKLIIIFSVCFTIGASIRLDAQDRHFSWTYESTTLPKGGIDIEPWVTLSSGKENFYSKYENRLEFETGLSNKLQTALYLNSKHITQATSDSTGHINGIESNSSFSFSNEWKMNILNPSTSPIGLGLYAEFGVASKEVDFELKLLLDKRLPKSMFAYNLVNEFEFEYEFEKDINGKGEIEIRREYVIENDFAYMYFVKPSFGVGLEAQNHNIFVKGQLEHSVIFLGPTIFYAQKNFYTILNVFPQLTNLKGDGLDLDEHEKMTARIIVGISL